MTLYSYIHREILLPRNWSTHCCDYTLYLRVQDLDGRDGHEHYPHQRYIEMSGTRDVIDPVTGRLYPFQREYILPYQIVHSPSEACCRVGKGAGLEEAYDAILRVFCEMLDRGVRFDDSMPERVPKQARWEQPDGYDVYTPQAPAWNRQPPPWAYLAEPSRNPELLNVYGPTVKVKRSLVRDVANSGHQALTKLRAKLPVWLLPHSGAVERQMALHYAAESGASRNVYKATKLGAAVNHPDPNGRTALHVALGNGRHNAAQALVMVGASVSASTHAGWTALMSASMHGYSDLAAQMLDANAEMESRTLGGQTALLVATAFGRDRCVQQLLSRSADVNCSVDVLRYTPIVFASGNCDAATVKLLLDNGADPNCETVDHITALRLAEQRGRKEIIELLKKYGAVK